MLQPELLETVDRYEELKTRVGARSTSSTCCCARGTWCATAPRCAPTCSAGFTHIFVDEFQDTDPLQAEIVLLLSGADPAVARWQDVTPAPGKLFVVGDPKQSIYRFRRADVGIYQAVKDLLVASAARRAST